MCRTVPLGEASTEQETHIFYNSFSIIGFGTQRIGTLNVTQILRFETCQHVSHCAIGEASTEQETHMFYKSFSRKFFGTKRIGTLNVS